MACRSGESVPARSSELAAEAVSAPASAGQGSTMPAIPDSVTYAEHVAPILYAHCSRCHRLGEAGPFPLLGYDDAKPRAPSIKAATTAGYMPPWPADPSYRHFLDENVLTDEQIALLARWADQGAPRGDPRREPTLPVFPKGSQLGKPDLVVRMPTAYQIPGD